MSQEKTSIKWTSIFRKNFSPIYMIRLTHHQQSEPPSCRFSFVLWSEDYSLFIMDFYWSCFVWGFISFLENSLLFFRPHHIGCRILTAQPGMPKDWTQPTAEKTLNSNHWTTKELPQGFFFLIWVFYNFVDSGSVSYIKVVCFFIVSIIFIDNLIFFSYILFLTKNYNSLFPHL